MLAQIKHIMFDDGKAFDNSFSPKDKVYFCILLRLHIGPMDKEGEESFDLKICTPNWLNNKLNEGDTLIGRHYLIVKTYDYQVIGDRITKIVETCSGETWSDIGQKLSRYAYWEFEDFSG